MTKFCEDCKFFKRNGKRAEDHKCLYPQKEKSGVELVVRGGEGEEEDPRICYLERSFEGEDSCGKEGKWFQPRGAEEV